MRELGRLLFYPAESEGLAHTPNVVRLGLFPNQHVLPAIEWARDSLGKRRIFMVGSDSIYPRVVGAIVADSAEKMGVKLVGEAYIPLSDMLGPGDRYRTADRDREAGPGSQRRLREGELGIHPPASRRSSE